MPDKPIPQGAMAAARNVMGYFTDNKRLDFGNLTQHKHVASIVAAHTADLAELARVKKQRDELLAVVHLFEWYDDDDGDKRCSCCSGVQGHTEHAKNCNIRIAIANAEKVAPDA